MNQRLKNNSQSKILLIDTSSNHCSVALAENNRIIATGQDNQIANHSRFLIPTINGLFQDSGWKFNAIDVIIYTVGPGSFTGIRAGLSVAKTFAMFTDANLIGISNFDLLAHQSQSKEFSVILKANAKNIYIKHFSKDTNNTNDDDNDDNGEYIKLDDFKPIHNEIITSDTTIAEKIIDKKLSIKLSSLKPEDLLKFALSDSANNKIERVNPIYIGSSQFTIKP